MTLITPSGRGSTLGQPDIDPPAVFVDPPGGGSPTGRGWLAFCVRRGDKVLDAATVNLHAGYIGEGQLGSVQRAHRAAGMVNAALDRAGISSGVLIGCEAVFRPKTRAIKPEQWQPQAWFVEALADELAGCHLVAPCNLGKRHTRRLGGTGRLVDAYTLDLCGFGKPSPWRNENPKRSLDHVRAAFDGCGELLKWWHAQKAARSA